MTNGRTDWTWIDHPAWRHVTVTHTATKSSPRCFFFGFLLFFVRVRRRHFLLSCRIRHVYAYAYDPPISRSHSVGASLRFHPPWWWVYQVVSGALFSSRSLQAPALFLKPAREDGTKGWWWWWWWVARSAPPWRGTCLCVAVGRLGHPLSRPTHFSPSPDASKRPHDNRPPFISGSAVYPYAARVGRSTGERSVTWLQTVCQSVLLCVQSRR